MTETIPIRKRLRPRAHNPTAPGHDLSGQLQEPFAHGRDLRPGVAGRCQVKAHLLHQHIRRRRQHYPERVGPEVGTTGPSDLHAVVQFFNPVFNVAPRTVDLLVNPLRTLLQVRDHEPWVVFGLLVGRSHHLGLIDDPSFPQPSLAGSVPAFAIDMLGLARDLRRPTDQDHHRRPARPELHLAPGPPGHADPHPPTRRRPRRVRLRPARRTHPHRAPGIRTHRRPDPTDPEVARTRNPKTRKTPGQQGFYAFSDT